MTRITIDLNTSPALRTPAGLRAAPPLVGRDAELRRLTLPLTLAAEGDGKTVFLTGQSGIGKTRLAQEALALAKACGFTVLEGRAFPLEARLAYAPILDALGPLLRSFDPARLAVMVDGLSDLGRLFGGLCLPSPEPLGDPALEKTRLFEAVSRFLARLTEEAPVALFIDDVHWADSATLEMLHYVARGLAGRRALLLATYRVDDPDASGDLLELVQSLQRAGLAEEIVIPRLEPDAVEKLAESILGGEVPADLIALLNGRAAGTPLFVEAFITALIDTGNLARSPSEKNGWALDAAGATALPASIRRLIIGRLARLAPADRRVFDLVAVLGDATSHAILLAVSKLQEETLLEALRRLRARGLVAEGMDGLEVVYSMTHPLIQEVPYAELPEMERRRAHIAAIEVLESFHGEGRLDDLIRLTRHYLGAGPDANPNSALAVLIGAGERARSLYANEEAARYFETALAMLKTGWRRVPSGAVEGGEGAYLHRAAPKGHPAPASTLPHVLERLGEAWERLGKRGAAVEVWNEALAERERAGPSEGRTAAVSRLRRRLARAEWDRGHFDIANSHLSAEFAALAGREPCQELADLYVLRHGILILLGDAVGVAEASTQLLSIAEQSASPRAKAEASLAAFTPSLWQSDLADARERALTALIMGEQMQDLAICCRAHIALGMVGMRLGDHHFMRYHAERGLAVAQRLGAPYFEILFRLHLAHANFLSGAWDESLGSSMEAIALTRRVGHPRGLAYSLPARAIVLALRGDFPEAEACIFEAMTTFPRATPADGADFCLASIAETALALERGQVGPALRISEGFVRASRLPPAPIGLTSSNIPIGLTLLAGGAGSGRRPGKRSGNG